MVFKRLKQNLTGDYAKRQFYMMGNLGLFYLILIALFAIPLLGAFVVILIQGIHDFRHIILGVGIVAAALLIYFTGRFFFRFFRKLREDGLASFKEANRQARNGAGTVQIDMFRGLVSFTVNSGPPEGAAQITGGNASLALPGALGDGSPGTGPDPVRQIQDLKEMLLDGTIDESEYEKLKAAVIRQAADRRPQESNLKMEPDEYITEDLPDMERPTRYSH